MNERVTAVACAGCGAAVGDGSLPFRCPESGAAPGQPDEDIDHVIARALDTAKVGFPSGGEPNPFVRYRALFHSHDVALQGAMRDDAFIHIVERLDAAVASVDGAGFRATPFAPSPRLADAAGVGSSVLWVKDETGNVSGSHKARHLMGIAIYLDVLERLGRLPKAGASRPTLAIASCGNAALAAAVVARAAGRPLAVFVPTDASPVVVARLQELGARLNVCARVGGEKGDPCYLRFREAVERGALAFGCQGPDNGLTIEGGETLAYEMVSDLAARGEVIDRLFVQVGGGALASACIQGLREAMALGALARMPRVHTVQTRGAYPLRRAWERLSQRILSRVGVADPGDDRRRAEILQSPDHAAAVVDELAYVRRHRRQFMWPWEATPHSIAHGILDDETYDFAAVLGGMIETGGWPVVVDEATLERANELGRAATGIPVDPTGSSGLAGVLDVARAGAIPSGERIAVLFTGRARA